MKKKKNRNKSLKQRHSKTRVFRERVLYPLDKLSYSTFFLIFGNNDIGKSLTAFSDIDRVLLFSPHQDDETLGCGGFLLANHDKAIVQTVYITNGKGPVSVRMEPERLVEARIRSAEAEQVCKSLQIKKPKNLGFDNIKVDSYDEILKRKLTDEIEEFKPSIIMTPFFTDANPEHFWLTKNLAKVNCKSCKNVYIIFYRVHGQIPQPFQNAYFGLTQSIHQNKEDILNLFKSQSLDKKLVKSKYLLYSKMFPRHLKNNFKSIERYTTTNFENFKILNERYDDDKYLKKLRSINYAPYSFRCFLLNELIFKRSDFVKYGPDLI